MNKTQLHQAVTSDLQEFFKEHKIPTTKQEGLLNIIDEYLKPKSSGAINPPKLDKDGNIIEAYCRFHQRYEKVGDMVTSNGKSKGYCKAGISNWNKRQKTIKQLQAQVTGYIDEDDFEKAKKLSNEVKELKETINDPKTFDYDADWEAFNG